MLLNNIKSFLCKLITNLQPTRQPDLYLLSFIIVNIKQPSPDFFFLLQCLMVDLSKRKKNNTKPVT